MKVLKGADIDLLVSVSLVIYLSFPLERLKNNIFQEHDDEDSSPLAYKYSAGSKGAASSLTTKSPPPATTDTTDEFSY